MWDVVSQFKVCCRDTVTASNPNATTGGSSVGARKLPAATPPDVNATWLDVDDPPGATCEVSWRRVSGPPGQHASLVPVTINVNSEVARTCCGGPHCMAAR